MQENVKEFIDTMAYIDMVIKLDSPSRRQERILKECLRTGEQSTEGFQPEDRVLPYVTWKDLVAATIKLGSCLSRIIERCIEKEIKKKEVGILTSIIKIQVFSVLMRYRGPDREVSSDSRYIATCYHDKNSDAYHS